MPGVGSGDWRALKELDLTKYHNELNKRKLHFQHAKESKQLYWASGTKEALYDKRDYYANRRLINQAYREKKKLKNILKRETETSRQTPVDVLNTRRKLMTHEQKKAHDNAKKRERKTKRSHQKRTADKIKSARYMREYRQKQKTEHFKADDSTESRYKKNEIKKGTRRHCYNTGHKIKKTLKSSFSEDEGAAITARLVVTRTPERKKQNLQKLSEYPEVRQYFRKELSKLEWTQVGKKSKLLSRATKSLRNMYFGGWRRTKEDISRFFRNPLVSKVLPHRRFATKKGPGYIMLTSIKQAHQLYQECSGKKVSFSLFAKQRPRHVRKLGSVPVETCLCVSCTNVKIKIDTLNRLLPVNKENIPSERKMFQFILCPFKGSWPTMDCIIGECSKCKDRIRPFTLKAWEVFEDKTSWMHWERRCIDGVTKLDLFPYSGKVSDLLAQLNGDLEQPVKGMTFIQHLFNAFWQHEQYLASKHGLIHDIVKK